MNHLPANETNSKHQSSFSTTPTREDVVADTGNNLVCFQNNDGQEVRGMLLRLLRHSVVFEILQTDLTLSASEVLNGFKVIASGRPIFFGRAVVSGLVNTGTALVCEVKLTPPENESAFFLPTTNLSLSPGETYDHFFAGWQREYRISPEFKVLVVDVAAYLTGVRQWLDQVAFTLAQEKDGLRNRLEQELLESTAERIIKGFNVQHERFEEMAYKIPPELLGAHQEFVRRHWHRLFLCAPFGHRTFYKPLGYAGDYEMMNMIYRNQPEGRSLYEKLIHLLLVSQWPARSVRNRVTHLNKTLVSETARVARAGRRAKILNVGCGPARELRHFMQGSPLSDEIDCTLLDFSKETLAHASEELDELKRKHARRGQISTCNVSVNQLLRRAVRQGDIGLAGPFDLIYCAGLFDYLSEHTCRELVSLFYQNIAPGGLVVVANMDDSKPFRNFIEFVLDWHLIYRKAPEIDRFASSRDHVSRQVVGEGAWGNLFLHVRKPE